MQSEAYIAATIWYEFVATVYGSVEVSIEASDFSAFLAVYTDTNGQLSGLESASYSWCFQRSNCFLVPVQVGDNIAIQVHPQTLCCRRCNSILPRVHAAQYVRE